ncbi:unnamed protein product [Heligmosomoides polygyrus]|uniref:COesterase domain-containing protein n=1 Tax=Heligmosomoides polygyrus TaxID=6339 RepID=A0A183FGN0_HELPZ|nr:unnamed protein product [Heligmosomoides polygyrus]
MRQDERRLLWANVFPPWPTGEHCAIRFHSAVRPPDVLRGALLCVAAPPLSVSPMTISQLLDGQQLTVLVLVVLVAAFAFVRRRFSSSSSSLNYLYSTGRGTGCEY